MDHGKKDLPPGTQRFAEGRYFTLCPFALSVVFRIVPENNKKSHNLLVSSQPYNIARNMIWHGPIFQLFLRRWLTQINADLRLHLRKSAFVYTLFLQDQ